MTFCTHPHTYTYIHITQGTVFNLNFVVRILLRSEGMGRTYFILIMGQNIGEIGLKFEV